jgi:hypothetical protein
MMHSREWAVGMGNPTYATRLVLGVSAFASPHLCCGCVGRELMLLM